MIQLGQKVRDRVTGFQGIVIGKTEWLNGCVTIGIRPKLGKDGAVKDPLWVDEPQVEVLEEKSILGKISKAGGGPDRSSPTREMVGRRS